MLFGSAVGNSSAWYCEKAAEVSAVRIQLAKAHAALGTPSSAPRPGRDVASCVEETREVTRRILRVFPRPAAAASRWRDVGAGGRRERPSEGSGDTTQPRRRLFVALYAVEESRSDPGLLGRRQNAPHGNAMDGECKPIV